MTDEEGLLTFYLGDTTSVDDRLLNPPSPPPPEPSSPPPGSSFLPRKSPNQDVERRQTAFPSRSKTASRPVPYHFVPRGSSVKDQNADTPANDLIDTTSQNHLHQPLELAHHSRPNKQQSQEVALSDSGRRDDGSDERKEPYTATLTRRESWRVSMGRTVVDVSSGPLSVTSTAHMSKHHDLSSENPQLPPKSTPSHPEQAYVASPAIIDSQDTSYSSQQTFPKSHAKFSPTPSNSTANLGQAEINMLRRGETSCFSGQGISSEMSAVIPTLGDEGACPGSEALSNDSSSTSANSHAELSLSSDGSEDGAFSREGRKKMLVDRLMDYLFTVLLPSLSDPYIVQRGTGGHGSSSQGVSDMRSSTTMPPSQGSSLDKNDGKKRSGDSDEGGSGGGGPKKRRMSSSNVGSATPAFACPYIKKDVHRYWMACPVRGWTSVHRVKQHLYRSHRQPITCPRCHEKFDTIPLRNEHLVEETRCEKKEKPDFEGFDHDQEQRLRRRQKNYEDEADNWRDVYMILFPDTDYLDIPSPYVNLHSDTDSVVAEPSLSRYGRFLSQELPKIVERELETQVSLALESLEERLKIQLVEIVRKAQRTAHDRFMSANSEPMKYRSSKAEAERSVDLEENTKEPHEAVGGFGTVPVLPFENASGGAEDSGNSLHDMSLGAGPSSRQEAAVYGIVTEGFEDDMGEVDLKSLAIPEFNADGLEWLAWPGFDDVTDGIL